MGFDRTFGELKAHLKEIRREHAHLTTEDAFAYWFAQAMLRDPDDSAGILQALSGCSNDKNIDIITFSPTENDIYICQTKFRRKLKNTSESRNDLDALATISS